MPFKHAQIRRCLRGMLCNCARPLREIGVIAGLKGVIVLALCIAWWIQNIQQPAAFTANEIEVFFPKDKVLRRAAA